MSLITLSLLGNKQISNEFLTNLQEKKSLERLQDTPNVKKRSFLKFLGGTAAGALTGKAAALGLILGGGAAIQYLFGNDQPLDFMIRNQSFIEAPIIFATANLGRDLIGNISTPLKERKELTVKLAGIAAGTGTLLAALGLGVAAGHIMGYDPFFSSKNVAGFIYWNQSWLAPVFAGCGSVVGGIVASNIANKKAAAQHIQIK